MRMGATRQVTLAFLIEHGDDEPSPQGQQRCDMVRLCHPHAAPAINDRRAVHGVNMIQAEKDLKRRDT